MKTMNIKAKMMRKTVVAIGTTLAVLFAGFATTTYAQENTSKEITMTIDGLVNNCEIITFSPSSVDYNSYINYHVNPTVNSHRFSSCSC